MLKNIYDKAFIIWFVPLMFSFGFYDRTGNLTTNFWVFKLTMVFVASFTAYIALRNYFKTHSDWLSVAGKVVAVNTVLDMVVLVLLFKMPFVAWISQVLPVYLVIIPLACYLMSQFIPKTKLK
jgi:hypothetical protein